MTIEGFEMFAVIRSLILSLLIFFPLMMVVKNIFVKHLPQNMQLENLSDNIVRILALTIFLIMIGVAVVVFDHWKNWHGILAPIEVILLFFYIPLYKKME